MPRWLSNVFFVLGATGTAIGQTSLAGPATPVVAVVGGVLLLLARGEHVPGLATILGAKSEPLK